MNKFDVFFKIPDSIVSHRIICHHIILFIVYKYKERKEKNIERITTLGALYLHL